MRIKAPQLQARLFGRAGESVTHGDRRKRELEFGSSFPPLTARPNKRRDDAVGWPTGTSPLGGTPREHKNRVQTLTPVGHPIKTPAERRFAPTTVRQPRNGVRYELEQVSDSIGIRTNEVPPPASAKWSNSRRVHPAKPADLVHANGDVAGHVILAAAWQWRAVPPAPAWPRSPAEVRPGHSARRSAPRRTPRAPATAAPEPVNQSSVAADHAREPDSCLAHGEFASYLGWECNETERLELPPDARV